MTEERIIHAIGGVLQTFYHSPTHPPVVEHRRCSLPGGVIWQRLRYRWQNDGQPVGLCLNWLVFPAEALDVFVTRFHERGLRRLSEDAGLQRAIAHAFWQTTWAGSAIRGQRGTTWPVAFVPIHRPWIEKASPLFAERWPVGQNRWIFGRHRRLLWQCRQLVFRRGLSWRENRFDSRSDAEAECLAWLNRRGFVDRFIGGNAGIRDACEIRALVPVHGSHLLTRLAAGEGRYFTDGPFSPSAVVAATNSGFFLNFPEEYAHPWTAMNDPVGLFVENGRMAQLPLVSRGTLLIDKTGQTAVARVSMRDVAIRLPWESHWRFFGEADGFVLDKPAEKPGQIAVYTPAFLAEEPPEKRYTPETDGVDLVVLFGEVAEVRYGGMSAIPASGLVLSLAQPLMPDPEPERFLQPMHAPIQFRLQHEHFGLEAIRTAVAAGPVLLRRGNEPIPSDYFSHRFEDFRPTHIEDGRPTAAGIPPTRFPHDVTGTRAPRTLIGTLPGGELVLMVVDGRHPEHSLGATLQEAAALLQACGCESGLNLDGGGSSVLYIHDAAEKEIAPLAPEVRPGIVNLPSDVGHQERLIPIPLFIMHHGGA